MSIKPMENETVNYPNTTVIIRQSWNVLVITDQDDDNGEIDDNEFESYTEALECAVQKAEEHGVDITPGW